MSNQSQWGVSGKKLLLDQLKPGYRLFEDVRGNTGGQLFKKDHVIESDDIDTMGHFGVEEVWVYLTEDMKKKPLVLHSEHVEKKTDSSKTVLIVDDSHATRKNIRNMLERNGYVVVGEAEDGEDAILMNEVLKPDLITMDIIMKKVNGIKATTKIKNESPSTKVVMITQAAKPSLVQESIRCGASNFIIKPFEENALMSALKRIFAS